MPKLICRFAIAVLLVIPAILRVAAPTSNLNTTKTTKNFKISPENSLVDIVAIIIQIANTSLTKNNANESKVNHQASVENLNSVEFSNGAIANPIALQRTATFSRNFNHPIISRFTKSGTSS